MHENGSGLVLRYAVALFTEAVEQTSVKQTNGPRLVLTISALRHGLSPPTEVELEGVLNEVAGIEKIEVPKPYVWQKPQCRRSALENICSIRR